MLEGKRTATFHLEEEEDIGPKVPKERAGRAERFRLTSPPEEESTTFAQFERKLLEFPEFLEDVADKKGAYPWNGIGLLVAAYLYEGWLKTVQYASPQAVAPYKAAYKRTLRNRLEKGLVRVEDTLALASMEKTGEFTTTKEQRALYWTQLIRRIITGTRKLSDRDRADAVNGLDNFIRELSSD